jgi:signal peptidase II
VDTLPDKPTPAPPEPRPAASGDAGEPVSPAAEPGVAPAPAVTEPAGPGLFWRFAILLIITDQLTKALVRSIVPLYETKTLIPGFVDLVHVRNEGVAFGLLNDIDLSYKWLLTTALAMGALLGVAYYAHHVRREEFFARLGLSMILGGAIGNLIDRAWVGYVLDFVDVYWGTWHFWAFNVADASISIGAVLVFADLLLGRRHASHPV